MEYEPQSQPIQRLPPELLAEIFLCSSMPNRSLSKISQRYRVMVPSHVCQKWRDIAVSTPILWSFVLFSVRIASEAHIELEIDCARAWLSRAKQCALSVAICIRPYGRLEQLAVATAWNLFVPHCTRWREIILDPVPVEMLGVIRAAEVRGNLPMLEAIELSHLRGTFTFLSRLDLFKICPKICRLKIRAIGDPCKIRVPWGQITDFHMISYGVPDTLNILTLAPNLVHFTGAYIPNLLPRPIMTHWHLSALHISCDRKNSTSYALDHLILPHLCDLSVEFMVVPEIVSLLSRSACTLTKLGIPMRESNAHELAELLGHTPELQELGISFDTGAELRAILDSLHSSPARPGHSLVPKL